MWQTRAFFYKRQGRLGTCQKALEELLVLYQLTEGPPESRELQYHAAGMQTCAYEGIVLWSICRNVPSIYRYVMCHSSHGCTSLLNTAASCMRQPEKVLSSEWGVKCWIETKWSHIVWVFHCCPNEKSREVWWLHCHASLGNNSQKGLRSLVKRATQAHTSLSIKESWCISIKTWQPWNRTSLRSLCGNEIGPHQTIELVWTRPWG